ncbi:MAG: MFS transporter [Clostridiaceae bacterium]
MTREERAWILQDFGNSAYSIAITTALLPVFFKSVAASGMDGAQSTAYWGYANSIATLIIAVLAPILGSLADYKGYKNRFFNFFVFLAIISTAALSTVGEGNWMYCLLIYIVSVIGSTGASIFYDSFLTDVTTDEKMDMISSQGFGFGYLGGTIGFGICMAFILLGPKYIGISTTDATRVAFIITAVWWFVFSLPFFKNVKQKYYLEGRPENATKVFQKLFHTFKEIVGYKNLFMFFLAYFFYIDGVHTIISMATPIGMDMGLDSQKLLIILLFIQLIAFPFAIIYGALAKRFGARAMILVGIITYIIITIYALMLKTIVDFWILAFLVATAQGGIQALSRSYFGKLIPKEKSAEYFGVFNIFGKISSIMGPVMVGVVSQATGDTRFGILSLIILFILGFYFFMKVSSNPAKLQETEN